jgi:hypothetical protein
VVPVLFQGNFSSLNVDVIMEDLRVHGSAIAPGFARPEGIVIYHLAAGVGFKKTFEGDENGKTAPKNMHKMQEVAAI